MGGSSKGNLIDRSEAVLIIDCKQGGSEWMRHRLGIPTASQFHRIITPKTMEPSSQATGYMNELLAEWVTGVPHGIDASPFMERGAMLEDAARNWYAMERDVDPQRVGVVLRDDRMVGCSPDSLVGEDGGLEIKVPSAHVQVGTLLRGKIEAHAAQVQGCLWLTGRTWWDLVSWNPEIPTVVTRVERDAFFIKCLEAAVNMFVEHLVRSRATLLTLGCKRATRLLVPAMSCSDPFPF